MPNFLLTMCCVLRFCLQLREVSAELTQVRSDKEHYEREADRLQDESARLAGELSKATKVRACVT